MDLRQILNRLRESWTRQSTGLRFLAIFFGVVALLGLIVYFTATGETNYVTLARGLDPADAGAISEKLKAANKKYKLEDGGTTIKVAENEYAESRVTLAKDGLATNATGKGYELFDEANPLSSTPFIQSVNYTRALQTELAKSIQTIDPVASARVLIARAEPSPFIREQKPTTASVTLKLKPNANLNRGQTTGIVALVSRAVEGLKPENVTIVDQSGRLLSDARSYEEGFGGGGQMDYRRDLETYLAGKAQDMLTRTLGAGRAIIQVSADIDHKRIKERSERVIPEEKTIIAERLMTSKTQGGSKAGGVAGTGSNVTRAGGSGAGGGGGTSTEETIQSDYAVSKSYREMEDRMSAVSRITIAALVDLSPAEGTNAPPISQADVQDIIKRAIGYKDGRDEITVSSVKLGTPAPPEEPQPEAPSALTKFAQYVNIARYATLGIALLAVIGLLGLVLFRRSPAPAVVNTNNTTIEAPSAETLERMREQKRREEFEKFLDQARNDPDAVARLLERLLA